jgi:hypothetical protein
MRSRVIRSHSVWACAALLFCGCAGEGIEDPAGAGFSCAGGAGPFLPTLTCIQRVVFTPTCAASGCHLEPGAQQGLDLSDGMAWSSLTGVPSAENSALNRVTPGDPDRRT